LSAGDGSGRCCSRFLLRYAGGAAERDEPEEADRKAHEPTRDDIANTDENRIRPIVQGAPPIVCVALIGDKSDLFARKISHGAE
jgi:hypothetical protein